MGTVSIDVIKMGYRQNQTGDVLTLRLNLADEVGVAAIALARPGSQFKMTLTDLDEDGNASNAGVANPAREAGSSGLDKPLANPASRLTKLACICCNDKEYFWKYLEHRGWTVRNRDDAKEIIYEECDVKSRKEFIIGSPAGNRWIKFYDEFALWRDVPEDALR